jgi:peroxiredoxin
MRLLFLLGALCALTTTLAAQGPAAPKPKRMALPRPIPPSIFATPEGARIDLAQYKGKVVAVEFLLTTCPHCQRSSRLLQKLLDEYGPRGFQVVGVAANQMAHMLIGDFKKSQGVSFPIGFSTDTDVKLYLQHPIMEILYYPNVIFIDRTGNIRAHYPGGDDFYRDEEKNARAQIEALLKEGAAPARPTIRSVAPAKAK